MTSGKHVDQKVKDHKIPKWEISWTTFAKNYKRKKRYKKRAGRQKILNRVYFKSLDKFT